jgi:cytochrome c oxidase assembly factor CtaG
MTTTRLLLTAWDADPFAIGMALVALALYGWRVRDGRRFAVFGASVALFLFALTSPVGVLAKGYLFSAHMVQHLLLVLVVPALAWLGVPAEAPTRAPAPRIATRILPAWLLGVSAMWLWHAPTLCDAAGSSVGIARLQTISLLAMGGAFWWPIFAPKAAHRLAPFGGMLYLFTACVACTLLGVFVTFSPLQPCSIFAHPVDRLGALPLLRDGWGLGPSADQEAAGLVMWVPACLVYGAGILAMLARFYREADEPAPSLAEEGA